MPVNTNTPSLDSIRKRKFLLLTGLVVAVAVAALGLAGSQGLAAWSSFQETQVVNKKTEEVRRKALEAQTILSSVEYAQNQQIVGEALPDSKPFLELLANLDKVGKATGVTISNVAINPGELASGSASLQTSSGTKEYDNLLLEFQVTSTFDAFREFMQTLEKVAPFTTIVQFDIAERAGTLVDNQAANADVQLVSVNVVSHTYFLSNPREGVGEVKALADAERTVLLEVEKLQSIDLPVQTEIQGGGREDLFGVKGYKDIININQ